MPESDKKHKLTNIFWQYVQEISKNISNLTETTTGNKIDYFGILKKRLDGYLKLMQANPDGASDPSHVMGPAFAELCGSPDNAIIILTATKMLTLTLGAVKEYLSAVEIEEIKH